MSSNMSSNMSSKMSSNMPACAIPLHSHSYAWLRWPAYACYTYWFIAYWFMETQVGVRRLRHSVAMALKEHDTRISVIASNRPACAIPLPWHSYACLIWPAYRFNTSLFHSTKVFCLFAGILSGLSIQSF